MARETITLKVAEGEEQSTIEAYETFGWEVMSTQQVFNKDSHLEKKDDKIMSVTETTNFVRIMMSRDRNMPNYQRLCELQAEYENVPFPPKPNQYKGIMTFFAVIFIIGGIAMIFLRNTYVTYVFLSFFIIAVIILIVLISKGKTNKKRYDELVKISMEHRAEIVNEARNLLYNS